VMAGISHIARLLVVQRSRQQLRPRLLVSERANHGWPRLPVRLPGPDCQMACTNVGWPRLPTSLSPIQMTCTIVGWPRLPPRLPWWSLSLSRFLEASQQPA